MAGAAGRAEYGWGVECDAVLGFDGVGVETLEGRGKRSTQRCRVKGREEGEEVRCRTVYDWVGKGN